MHATLYNKDDIVIDRTLFIPFLILFVTGRKYQDHVYTSLKSFSKFWPPSVLRTIQMAPNGLFYWWSQLKFRGGLVKLNITT